MKDKKNHINSRRDTLRKLLSGAGMMGMGGLFWGSYINEAQAEVPALRPPGALLDDKDFLKTCIKCGLCVESCPYDTLKLAKPQDAEQIGAPFFTPRNVPCYMCTDVPCAVECPSGSLSADRLINLNSASQELDINQVEMGLAVIDRETCIAYWGIQCDACYRACPLMGEALTLDIDHNDRTGKHVFMKPVVHSDVCTGCGMCEHACVTEEAAIFVLPKEVAMGKVGNHYVRGWDEKDEARIDPSDTIEINKVDDSAIDYLNDWEDLIDE